MDVDISDKTALAVLLITLSGLFVGSFVVLSIPSLKRWLRRRKAKREEVMGKEREITDALVTMMEDLEYGGYISRRQKIYWYKRFEKVLPVAEVAPRNFTVLKRRIRLRLLNGGPPAKLPDLVPPTELEMLLRRL